MAETMISLNETGIPNATAICAIANDGMSAEIDRPPRPHRGVVLRDRFDHPRRAGPRSDEESHAAADEQRPRDPPPIAEDRDERADREPDLRAAGRERDQSAHREEESALGALAVATEVGVHRESATTAATATVTRGVPIAPIPSPEPNASDSDACWPAGPSSANPTFATIAPTSPASAAVSALAREAARR